MRSFKLMTYACKRFGKDKKPYIHSMRYISHLSEMVFLPVKNRIENYFFPKHIMSIGTFFQNALYPSGNQGAMLHKTHFLPKYQSIIINKLH